MAFGFPPDAKFRFDNGIEKVWKVHFKENLSRLHISEEKINLAWNGNVYFSYIFRDAIKDITEHFGDKRYKLTRYLAYRFLRLPDIKAFAYPTVKGSQWGVTNWAFIPENSDKYLEYVKVEKYRLKEIPLVSEIKSYEFLKKEEARCCELIQIFKIDGDKLI